MVERWRWPSDGSQPSTDHSCYELEPQAAATAALEDGHDDEVTTSGDGGTNAAVGVDMLETERSDSQPSQAGPYLTGSTQKY